jgi:hypothetical protein
MAPDPCAEALNMAVCQCMCCRVNESRPCGGGLLGCRGPGGRQVRPAVSIKDGPVMAPL